MHTNTKTLLPFREYMALLRRTIMGRDLTVQRKTCTRHVLTGGKSGSSRAWQFLRRGGLGRFHRKFGIKPERVVVGPAHVR